MKKAELIFIPAPGAGHLVSALEFARRLIDHDEMINISIILIKVSDQSTSLASSQPRVRLIHVPGFEFSLPSSVNTKSLEAQLYETMEKNVPLMRNSIIDILSSCAMNGVQVKGIVLDFFCTPFIAIAKELNLSSYVFLTTNAGFLALMRYLLDKHNKETSMFKRDSSDNGLLIPGFVNPVPPNVLPSGLFCEDGYDAYIKLAKWLAVANGVLVNTFPDLEHYSMDYFLNEQCSYPSVYPIGPMLGLKAPPPQHLDHTRRDELIKWLDAQPEASVVFLCFGSGGGHGAAQVKEIAHGLEQSEYRFIWSIRMHQGTQGDASDHLPEGFLDRVNGRGMICGWAPQLEILSHKAVGGFVSHCGWNSILESLWFGVPIVTWPLYAEQQLNAFMMVKEFGLAVEMRLDFRGNSGELLMANDIETAIRCLMEKDYVVKKKVKEISVMARKAALEDGSSSVSIERFLRDVVGTDMSH